MSTNKETTRFKRKERCMDSVRDEKLFAKADTTKKEACIRPHFELHTQSSLLKRKEPKQYSTMSLKRLKKSETNCVCKRRNGVVKQSKSMQALKTILMREKDCREVFGSLPNKLTKTAHSSTDCSKNSLAPLQSDSTDGVFHDFVKWTKYLNKSSAIEVDPQRNEIAQIGEHLEKLHTSFQDDQMSKHTHDTQGSTANSLSSAFLQNNWDAFTSIENHPFVETRRGSRLQSSDDESEDSRQLNIHHVSRSRGKSKDSPLNEEYSFEAQVCRHSVPSNVTCRSRARETWTSEGAAIQSRDVGVDHSCDFDLRDTRKSMKRADDTQPVMSDVRTSSRRKFVGRNIVSNLPIWKPAGVNKASTESTASLTQKSSRSTVKSIASGSNQQRSKHSSVENAKSLDSESTRVSTSKRRTNLPMKENRDPRADHINYALKLCEHLVKTRRTKDVKEREMANAGTLRKKRRSVTKVVRLPPSNPTPISGKHKDAKMRRSRSRSKSRSRRWQSRSATPKNSFKSRQDTDDNRFESVLTYKKRSRPSEVMHTLKEIINSSRCNEDVEEKTKVSESEEASKSVRTVGTQTSLHCKKNVETECNTMPYKGFCKDVEVSCDLVGSTSSKTHVDPWTIGLLVSEDISVHTIVGPRSVKYAKTDDESEYSNITERASELIDKTLIEDSTELESRISAETTATSVETIDTNHVFVTGMKTIMDKGEVHEDEIPSKSENHGDSIKATANKHEESTERLNDNDAIGSSANDLFSKKSRWTPLSLYDYDASCSDSSEEVTQYLEDDTRHEDAVAPESGANSIPSDVLVAFQIAAEYARNLHKAVLLYNDSLMSQESERQSRTASEARGTSMLSEDRRCVHRSASFLSCRSDDGSKSEGDTEYRLIMTNDEDGLSAQSSSTSSLHSHQLGLQNTGGHSCPEINLKEENVLPQSVETSMKLVQKRSDLMLVDVRSFVRLLVRRTREDHALEVLKLEELADDGKLQDGGKANNPATFSAIEFVSVILREHLVSLIYCLLCILAFWYLQFSFTCNSAK